MATMSTQQTCDTPVPAPVEIRGVQAPAPICGDCRHHLPCATSPGARCTLQGAKLCDAPVEPGQKACDDFATWPEGSPVPAFLAAMKF